MLAVLALALGVRLALVAAISGSDPSLFLGGDSISYDDPAKALVRTGHFAQSPERLNYPSLTRTPGYPGFIALVYLVFGESHTAVAAIQVVLSVGILYLAYHLANQAWGSATALLSLVLLAVDLNSTYLSLLLMSETLFTFLAVLAFAVGAGWVRSGAKSAWPAFFVGGLAALAIQVRPIAYYLPVAVVAGLWVLAVRAGWSWGRLARAALAFAAPCVVLIGGWQWRNYVVAGTAEFATVVDRDLLFYHGAGIIAERDGISLVEARQRLADESPGISCTTPEWIDYCKSKALTLITEYPVLLVKVQTEALVRYMLAPGVSRLTTIAGLQAIQETKYGDPVLLDLTRLGPGEYARKWLVERPERLAATVFGLAYLVVVYSGIALYLLARAWRGPGHGGGLALWMGGYVLYLLPLSALPEADSRFRVPIMPFLVMFSVLGYQRAWPRLRSSWPWIWGRRRRRPMSAGG